MCVCVVTPTCLWSYCCYSILYIQFYDEKFQPLYFFVYDSFSLHDCLICTHSFSQLLWHQQTLCAISFIHTKGKFFTISVSVHVLSSFFFNKLFFFLFCFISIHLFLLVVSTEHACVSTYEYICFKWIIIEKQKMEQSDRYSICQLFIKHINMHIMCVHVYWNERTFSSDLLFHKNFLI